MKIVIFIPSRYSSQRFPGKPLIKMQNKQGITKTLIEWTWNAAIKANITTDVYVLTDDQLIADEVERFGGRVYFTPKNARNGTERCGHGVVFLDSDVDYVLNLQGDSPLVTPDVLLHLVKDAAANQDYQVFTPVMKANKSALDKILGDRKNNLISATTVVMDKNYRALYFSRHCLPYFDMEKSNNVEVFHHLGVYLYKTNILQKYKNWPLGKLEQCEGLEQLRFLEQGIPIKCVEISTSNFWEVNNPFDIKKVEEFL